MRSWLMPTLFLVTWQVVVQESEAFSQEELSCVDLYCGSAKMAYSFGMRGMATEAVHKDMGLPHHQLDVDNPACIAHLARLAARAKAGGPL